ncbi:helix-turn-helix domain-containing protein [Acrocarpospora macrocephala]|uniref:TetR family transcriptional regulator n=1 Tax=Acrocarpospora macrocephala TaxID=150177 RepID=A0A5M3WWI7_9ACTN|nr:TetR/AcrR family transcriptional regulator [Acrocarpospora macrocephala]GES12309.1 TetR family transcriptional regulator [Acrocarpospora macrocephala]
MAESQHRSRRGRQAEAERNDRRVLDAAREVFAAHGADATVAEIAARAGVGMGSLYRRYGSKSDLLRQLCTQAMEESIQAAEAALAAPDAWTGLSDYVRACVARGSGALAPLAGSLETTPEMWETSRRGRRLLEHVVARAHSEGVLRSGVTALDVAWLVEFFGRRGPAAPGTEDEAIRRRLLAISLDGLRNRDAGPLPGPAPSAQHYERRWQTEPRTS